MSETPIMRQIRLALSGIGTRIFRNNVGQAWVGKVRSRGADYITLENPRPFHAGLAPGSSDLIGWHPVVITPEMVGRTVAVFCAVEAKTEKGRTRENQTAFLNAVSAAGGIGVLARSPEEAVNEVLRLSEH